MVSAYHYYAHFSLQHLIDYFIDLIKDGFIPSQHKEASDTSTHSHPDFFVETSIETLQVNISLTGNEYLYHYEFLGRVLGKSMYGECNSEDSDVLLLHVHYFH